MKFDIQKSFPYPVLRPYSDDYEESEYQVNVFVEAKDSNVVIHAKHRTSSDSILKLIKHQKSQYATVVSCRDTYLRVSEVGFDPEARFSIPSADLRGEVAVDCFIVANELIPNFQPDDLNAEYGSLQFDIEAAAVLAQDETQVFYFDRDLMKPVSSVFDIVVQDNLEPGKWQIDFNADRVRIGMATETKERVDLARTTREHKAVLINSIYFSTVMACLEAMKYSPSEVDSYLWFGVFQKQLHNSGLDLESKDTYLVAQELLRTPLLLLTNYLFKE